LFTISKPGASGWCTSVSLSSIDLEDGMADGGLCCMQQSPTTIVKVGLWLRNRLTGDNAVDVRIGPI